ncbi:MAG: GDSL-type esterase/lipase family protein [Pseudomonadota bacterium]
MHGLSAHHELETVGDKILKPRVLIIGDSFVEGVGATGKQGWAQLLRDARDDDAEFTLSGIGGDTIAKILNRQSEFFGNSYSKVVLEVGLNDSRYRPSREENEIPISNFGAGVGRFIELWRSNGSNVLLIGLTRVDETKTVPYKQDKVYRNALIDIYDKCLAEVAISHGARYLPVPKLNDTAEALDDGLHPSDIGHKRIRSAVEGAILG